MNGSYCGFPIQRYPLITMAHGGGGRLTQQLIDGIFRPAFQSTELESQGDCAILPVTGQGQLAFSTDSFVIQPLFFRGGDIGRMGVTGTANDLAMSGARPRYLSAGFILEEGFAVETLMRIVNSMAEAAKEIGVTIVAGDTKVVERGKGDGLFLNISGIGVISEGVSVSSPAAITAGDRIVVSGAIGRHGIAIMSDRRGLEFETPVVSDCAHLWPRVEALHGQGIYPHAMRDLTRGGLATALLELSETRGLQIRLDETSVPVDPPVRGACEMLGLDPLFVANEGTMIAVVAPEQAERALAVLHAFDSTAVEIGEVRADSGSRVRLLTAFGSEYELAKQSGEQLPRIC